MIRIFIIAGLFLIGCQSPSKGKAPEPVAQPKGTVPISKAAKTTPKAAKTTPKPAKTAGKGVTKAAAKQVVRAAQTKQVHARKRSTKKKIKWQDSLTWRSWNEAQQESAAKGKPVMLLIYANWCPRCRELAPIFKDPKLVALAKDLVLVRQDQDERPDWLAQYKEFGGYVPRIIFFGTDGQPRTDITSGRGRYPYFYTPRGVATLVRSMKAATTK